MTKEQLLERKTVLEHQIKEIEERIVTNKNKEIEKKMFARLNNLRDRLEELNKRISQL